MKKLPIKPTGHYVLVKPDPVEETYGESKIVIHSNDSEKSREHVASVKGTLVAVGSQAWVAYADSNPWAKVGDKVYFKRHVSDRVKDESDIINGKPQEYFLMSDENILATIEE